MMISIIFPTGLTPNTRTVCKWLPEDMGFRIPVDVFTAAPLSTLTLVLSGSDPLVIEGPVIEIRLPLVNL